MEQRHRTAMRRCRVHLMRDLKASVVSHSLVECGLLTETEEEDVRSRKTTQEKNEVIISCIPRKGPRAFEKFVTLLESFESQKSLAEQLRAAESGAEGAGVDGVRTRLSKAITSPNPSLEETNVADEVPMATQESLQPQTMQAPIPETGPAWTPVPDAPIAMETETAGTGGFSASMATIRVNLDDETSVYPMRHQPRGKSIVINNKNFHRKCKMNKRNGTDKDAQTLDKLWTDLGFLNSVHHDVSKPEIESRLSELATEDHSQYDCVIVSILTHGLNRGRIYTSDGEIVSLEKLLANFNSDRAHPSLLGKPKLFFIQACRGDDLDRGTDVPDSGTVDISHFLEQDCTDGSEFQSLPAQADMLIAYATTPGYVSWRNSEHGSWFIQAIDEVFRKCAYCEELCAMIVEVNKVVARDFEASGHHKQMPSPIIQLLRKLYFRPGYRGN